MQKQNLEYIGRHLTPLLCGYRKGGSTKTAQISRLEKLKLFIGKKGFTDEVLMDLGNAFDTVNH